MKDPSSPLDRAVPGNNKAAVFLPRPLGTDSSRSGSSHQGARPPPRQRATRRGTRVKRAGMTVIMGGVSGIRPAGATVPVRPSGAVRGAWAPRAIAACWRGGAPTPQRMLGLAGHPSYPRRGSWTGRRARGKPETEGRACAWKRSAVHAGGLRAVRRLRLRWPVRSSLRSPATTQTVNHHEHIHPGGDSRSPARSGGKLTLLADSGRRLKHLARTAI